MSRLTLATVIDLVRAFDPTVTNAQLQANGFRASPDDIDLLASYLEDAEDEFRATTDMDVRLSRAGTPGDRDTFDQVTYQVPGHENFKRRWSRVGGDYLNQEVTKDLSHGRILPFDSAEGDEAFIYRGLGQSGSAWDDVTDDQGDLWDIVDYRNGTVAFSPLEIDRAMVAGAAGVGLSSGRLRELRFAISYRYGTLGADRSVAGSTTLTDSITTSNTVEFTVGVNNANRLPTSGDGTVIVLINDEYFRVEVDTSADQLTVVERAVRGTDDEAHDSGDRVQYTPPAVRKAVVARAAMSLLNASHYSEFLPDTDDDMDKGEIYDNFEETWLATVEAMS